MNYELVEKLVILIFGVCLGSFLGFPSGVTISIAALSLLCCYVLLKFIKI
ncbi:MAG: hypothetical protein AABY07_01210 [Nanoarchaeota archaeon]